MDRYVNGRTTATGRRKRKSRWMQKLLLYLLAAVLMFVGGMLMGGVLSQQGSAESTLVPELRLNSLLSDTGCQHDGDVFEPDMTLLDVPCIDQRGSYPTGCESVTAVMALQRAGIAVAVEDFIDTYLPKAEAPVHDGRGGYHCEDPNEFFLGDPYSDEGWGCYAPAIKTAVELLLADVGSELQVKDLTGSSLTELYETCVCQGVPVMVWATMGMAEPSYGAALTVVESGRRFDWIVPEHCMLLVGADKYSYYFNDPLEGKTVAYGKAETERAYAAQGSQALAVK